MNKIQLNKLRMYRSLVATFEETKEVWGDVPAYIEAVERLQNKVMGIEEAYRDQKRSSVGATRRKNLYRRDLINRLLEMSGVLFAFGSKNSEVELISRMSFSRSFIERQDETSLLQIARAVLDDVQDFKEHLSDFGMTEELIESYMDNLSDYLNALSNPRLAITRRKTATQKLADLFDETDEIIKMELDRLTRLFESREPEFHHRYHSARIIVDFGTNKGSPQPDGGTSEEAA